MDSIECMHKGKRCLVEGNCHFHNQKTTTAERKNDFPNLGEDQKLTSSLALSPTISTSLGLAPHVLQMCNKGAALGL
jgi:hypothetical protein